MGVVIRDRFVSHMNEPHRNYDPLVRESATYTRLHTVFGKKVWRAASSKLRDAVRKDSDRDSAIDKLRKGGYLREARELATESGKIDLAIEICQEHIELARHEGAAYMIIGSLEHKRNMLILRRGRSTA